MTPAGYITYYLQIKVTADQQSAIDGADGSQEGHYYPGLGESLRDWIGAIKNGHTHLQIKVA